MVPDDFTLGIPAGQNDSNRWAGRVGQVQSALLTGEALPATP